MHTRQYDMVHGTQGECTPGSTPWYMAPRQNAPQAVQHGTWHPSIMQPSEMNQAVQQAHHAEWGRVLLDFCTCCPASSAPGAPACAEQCPSCSNSRASGVELAPTGSTTGQQRQSSLSAALFSYGPHCLVAMSASECIRLN